MRIRKQPLGDRNIVGARIEAKRKERRLRQEGQVLRTPRIYATRWF